jgi:hypothetical protein
MNRRPASLSNFKGGSAACIRAGKDHMRLLNEQSRMKRLQAEWPIDCPIYYYRANGDTVPALIKQISQTGLSVRILGDFVEGERLVWVAVKSIVKQASTP